MPVGPYSAAEMRLYPGKVDSIAAEIITTLTTAGDIEVSDNNEAQLDSASVLKEYIRVDKELTERAKDILEIRGLPYSHLGRTSIRRTLPAIGGATAGRACSNVSPQTVTAWSWAWATCPGRASRG